MKKMARNKLSTTASGRHGERAAADFLISKGFCILEMNYRCSHLEIDIIAEDEAHLIFVEVKSRTEDALNQIRYGRPGAAVTKRKQSLLVLAAQQYLRTHKTKKQPRLDVIEVYFSPKKAELPQITRINHIENAFGAR
jgi:putative endonuclease